MGLCHVDVAGQEHGYVVRIDPDYMQPPYVLQPGQNVTLSASYDASVDHFGKGTSPSQH